ncbi:uncharacterized protein LOC134219400 [Armigeres subalbatus]|uniref:uncharacterized protein LOC134219400 n=1 Tax=Armigeres subalbatus TaxID=124917 RepID=UPI002ED67899
MSLNGKFHSFKLVLLSLLFASASTSSDARNGDQVEGRYLIFPPTAPTRHQLISGIGIPLGTPEAVTSGWVLKAQYFLPTEVNHLKPNNVQGWNDSRRSFGKRETVTQTPLGNYEAFTARDIHIDTEPLPDSAGGEGMDEDDYFDEGDDNYWLDEDEQKSYEDLNNVMPPSNLESLMSEGYDAEGSRWMTYKTLEHIGEVYGSGGRECVLRSICEAASAEFTHTGGVFAELLHIMFAPSTTSDPISEHSDNEYHRAEQLGREGAPCHLVFHECRNSILDVFTGIHDPDTNSLLVAHDKVMKSFMK